MSAVGSAIYCWWESSEDYRHLTGTGVIIASSRAKRTLGESEAIERLRDEHDNTVIGIEVRRWHRVTQWDVDNGNLSEEADLGSYAEDASGRGWIDVALPTFAAAGDAEAPT